MFTKKILLLLAALIFSNSLEATKTNRLKKQAQQKQIAHLLAQIETRKQEIAWSTLQETSINIENQGKPIPAHLETFLFVDDKNILIEQAPPTRDRTYRSQGELYNHVADYFDTTTKRIYDSKTISLKSHVFMGKTLIEPERHIYISRKHNVFKGIYYYPNDEELITKVPSNVKKIDLSENNLCVVCIENKEEKRTTVALCSTVPFKILQVLKEITNTDVHHVTINNLGNRVVVAMGDDTFLLFEPVCTTREKIRSKTQAVYNAYFRFK